MKRVVAAAVGFVLMLSLGVMSNLYFNNVSADLLENINKSVSQAKNGDFEGARKTVQSAETFWEDRRRILSLTVNHAFLYEIDSRLTGLAALSTQNAKEEFLASAEQAAEALAYVRREK